MADVEKLFKDSGALLNGHFLLTSGRHSPVYWEKFHLLERPTQTVPLCGLIVERFSGEKIDLVAGPTLGGAILAFEVARQIGVRASYAERDPAGRSFRRGLGVRKGEKVLVVDDILTTGGSLVEVLDAIKKLGGRTVGIGVLVNRSEKEIDLGAPLFSCHRASAISYSAEECPLCKAGLPLVRAGGDKTTTA